jgi:hypothetical protein
MSTGPARTRIAQRANARPSQEETVMDDVRPLTAEDEDLVRRTFQEQLGLSEDKNEAARKLRQREVQAARQRGEGALRQAERAARKGDSAGAKRWSDIARQMQETAQKLAESEPPSDYEEEERVRSELLAGLRKLADQDNGLMRWHIRREIWEEIAEQAKREGFPMPPPLPPRPAHWTDALPPDLRDRLEQEDLQEDLKA